jgi:opacity protein-like surface antigen
MQRILAVTLASLCLGVLPALSQTQSKSWEFSLATNVGSTSSSVTFTSGGRTETNESDAQTYLGLDVRAGYFVVDGFSLEPEIYVLAVDKMRPMFNIGANAAYTFTIPESPVKPFVTAGYGIGNSNPMMQRLYQRSSEAMDVPVLRAGGGLKVFISKQVALKLEYRYERYTQENSETSYWGYSYSYEAVSNYHNVLIGFSVFLPGGE